MYQLKYSLIEHYNLKLSLDEEQKKGETRGHASQKASE